MAPQHLALVETLGARGANEILAQDVVMLLAAAVIVINFVVDVLYVVIDPRLKVLR